MSDHRHWREECGVVGIAGVPAAAELASLALHALQHRGQESAGITVADFSWVGVGPISAKYLADHGAQFPRGKLSCYEGGLRVPYLVRWPGKIAAGSRSDQAVINLDFFPTYTGSAFKNKGIQLVLDLAGNAIPLVPRIYRKRVVFERVVLRQNGVPGKLVEPQQVPQPRLPYRQCCHRQCTGGQPVAQQPDRPGTNQI